MFHRTRSILTHDAMRGPSILNDSSQQCVPKMVLRSSEKSQVLEVHVSCSGRWETLARKLGLAIWRHEGRILLYVFVDEFLSEGDVASRHGDDIRHDPLAILRREGVCCIFQMDSCCSPCIGALLIHCSGDNAGTTAVPLLSRPATPYSQTAQAAACTNPNKTESALFPSYPVHPRSQS